MLGGEGGPGRRGRSYGPSARSYGEAKAVISTRPKKHPGAALRAEAPKERSKNGGVSLARRAAGGAAIVELWTTPQGWPRRRGGSPASGPRGVRAFLNAQIR